MRALFAAMLLVVSTGCSSRASGPGTADGQDAAPAADRSCGDRGGLQPGAPWPMASYGPARCHRGAPVGPEAPIERWVRTVSSTALGSVSIGAGGNLFVARPSAYELLALDPQGRVRWTAPAVDAVDAPIIGVDGTLYVLGYCKRPCTETVDLVAISAEGSERWRVPLLDGYTVSVPAAAVLGDGSLVVPFVDGATPGLAIIGQDGKRRSFIATPWSVRGIAVAPDGAIVAVFEDRVLAFSPDGTARWTVPLPERGSGVAVGPDGTVYAWHGELDPEHISGMLFVSVVIAITSDGTRQWRTRLNGTIQNLAIGADRLALATSRTIPYAGSAEQAFFVTLDPKTGAEMTNVQFEGRPSDVRMDGAGTSYVVVASANTSESSVIAFNADGTRKWSWIAKTRLRKVGVAIANGVFLAVDEHGSIHAIGK